MDFLDKFAEEIVDAVGPVLGVDTGTIHEIQFRAAKKAVWIVLARMLRNG